MKKILASAFVVVSVIVLSGCSIGDQKTENIVSPESLLQNSASVPARAANINGTISSIEGNEIIIKKEIGGEVLTEEQMAKKKAERQKLTENERQAMRVSEVSSLKTEDVKMTIPVGTAIFKADGTGSGVVVKSELSEIKKGTYLSIWTNENGVEAVKIKGLN